MALPWQTTTPGLTADQQNQLARYSQLSSQFGPGGSNSVFKFDNSKFNPAGTRWGSQDQQDAYWNSYKQQLQDWQNSGPNQLNALRQNLQSQGLVSHDSGGMFGGTLGRFENFVTDDVAPYLPAAGMAALTMGTGAFAGAGAGTAGADAAAASDAGMLPTAGGGATGWGATSPAVAGTTGAADFTSPAWQAANSSQVPGIGSTITGVTPNMSTVPGISSEILGTGAPAATTATSFLDAGAGASSGLGGASGTVGQAFADTATGASGLGGSPGMSTVPAMSGGGLPSSVVGSSSQLPAGMGPIGDVSGGVGSTNSAYDWNAINSALTQPTGTSTVSSTLGKLASGAGNYLMQHPTLGLAGASLATQLLRKPGIPQEGQLNARYNAMEPHGQADIADARAGKITPSQQAQIDRFTKDSDSALKQYFVNSGQGLDSTSYLESKQKVDQAALAMKQGYVDQLFSQGLQELGLADSAQAQLINLRMMREQQTSDAMNNFMMSLGLMGAFSK